MRRVDADGQVLAVTSGQPGRLVRAAGLVRRHRLLAAALALVVAAGSVTAALVVPGGYGGTFAGPFGAIPAPLAATGQPRLLAHYYGPVVLNGGLAIVGSGNTLLGASGGGRSAVTDGIAAVNLRTGRMYWSYRRPGDAVAYFAVWPGGLYVLWDDGLLVRINPSTAAIAWQDPIGATGRSSAGVLVTPGPAARAAVLVVSRGGIDAVSDTTGSHLWSAKPGRYCQFYDPTLTADTLVVGQITNPNAIPGQCGASLRGYAVPDGRLRWQDHSEQIIPPTLIPVSSDLVVVEEGMAANPGVNYGSAGPLDVIDANSGRAVSTIAAGWNMGISDGDGLVFAIAGSSGRFEAWDAATGRMRWQQELPGGQTVLGGPFLYTSDTAGVVVGSVGPPIPDGFRDGKSVPSVRLSLYRYDAGTGRLLSRTPLPLLNVAGGGAANLAFMQVGTTLFPVAATSDGVISLIESSEYEKLAAGVYNVFAAAWPDLVVSG
jgi:hypothetical protein